MEIIKISELPKGMIIWNRSNILGITGATLPKKYYENYCVKIRGNILDFDLIEEQKNMKVMISQPMRGKPNEQIREERAELVKILTEQGYEVVDTVFDKAPEGVDEAIFYLAESIKFIGKVDMVVFMKGWEKARGCKIEHQVAVEYGKEVMYDN